MCSSLLCKKWKLVRFIHFSFDWEAIPVPVKFLPYVVACMNCYPQFVRPLSNMGEVRLTRSACLCVAVLWVTYKLAQGRPYLCYWLTWNYISSCTVTLNDNLVQSVFCLMGTPCSVWHTMQYVAHHAVCGALSLILYININWTRSEVRIAFVLILFFRDVTLCAVVTRSRGAFIFTSYGALLNPLHSDRSRRARHGVCVRIRTRAICLHRR
jgi:hypothetical protein